MPLDAHADTGCVQAGSACGVGTMLKVSPAIPLVSKHVNLAGVDLNLLVALEALLKERNVTLAGARIGLSQPAMSRALGRLRVLFGDDLLVRSSSGLVLTRRAERLAVELPLAMTGLRALIGSAGNGQEIVRTKLTLAMPDHQSLVLLSRLVDRLQPRAPLSILSRNPRWRAQCDDWKPVT